MPGNYYRLNRMLEILLVSGRPLAELDVDTAAPFDFNFRCFFLNCDRVQLYRRIDGRCEEMVTRGLLQVCRSQDIVYRLIREQMSGASLFEASGSSSWLGLQALPCASGA